MPPSVKSGITCGKCGVVSPLGRVFCGSCGARLELSGVTRQNVTRTSVDVGPIIKRTVGIILLVVVILAALVFIPQSRPIGVEGSRAGVGSVAALVRATNYLQRGKTVGRRLTEADLNGYLYGDTLKRMKVESMSVDITPDGVRIRMLRTAFQFDVGSYRIHPKISCELYLTSTGRQVRYRSARQGMLPMVGPFKSMVARQIYRAASALPEWAVAKSISEVQYGEDVMDVTLLRQ